MNGHGHDRVPRPGPRHGVALAAILLAILLAVPGAPAAADWPIYGRDLANSRNGGTDGPSFAQIPTLKEAWSFDSPTGDFTGTPVVARGVLVAGDYSGTVYALDAVTGKVRWTRKLGDPITSSAAIDASAPNGGEVYVPLAKVGGPRLAALSLRNGSTRWSTALTSQAGSSVYGSPTFWKGTVYIGTSGPNGDGSTARGTVVALRAKTGSVRWRTFMVPAGHDGGPVWSTPAIDTATGRLYVGTGNAYHPPAANTTDAILALDASTGAILGRHQAVAGDIFGPDNPAGPDADFGASPNLLRGPTGTPLVGAGAKDGVYYALDRATMKPVWTASLGPGSAIGGFIGSTVYDGKRIYGTNALTGEVGALGRDGSTRWTSADGGSADFSPLAMANGVLYTLNSAGRLAARDAATGTVLTTLSLGAPTFGGISTVGGAVYVAVGLGPPPPPAPQQYGKGSIVAFGDTSRSGGRPRPGPKRRMRVSVQPRTVRTGERARFEFTVTTTSGAPVRGARVSFGCKSAATGPRGRAAITARFEHRGRRLARMTAPGYTARTVAVTVRDDDGPD
jgi:polyvinyl alcohol dehydrogenase (cytochrome)